MLAGIVFVPSNAFEEVEVLSDVDRFTGDKDLGATNEADRRIPSILEEMLWTYCNII